MQAFGVPTSPSSGRNFEGAVFIKNEVTESNDLSGGTITLDIPRIPNFLKITTNGNELRVKFLANEDQDPTNVLETYILDGESPVYPAMPATRLEITSLGDVTTRWRVEGW